MKYLFCAALLSFSVFAVTPKRPTMSLDEKVLHLLNRLSFGPRPGEFEKLKSSGEKGIKAWIEEQLLVGKIQDALLDRKIKDLDVIKTSTAELFDKYKKMNDLAKEMKLDLKKVKIDTEMKRELRKKISKDVMPQELHRQMMIQKFVRAVESRKQLQEMLVDFWFNHFNVDIRKGNVKWLIAEYERQALRPHIFGDFLTLLQQTSHSPAMLFYLDNRLSQAKNEIKGKGLNENYAREIMELHTLGVDAGYSQKDVTELARILTGWSTGNKDRPEFIFKKKIHDNDPKIFLEQEFKANGGQEEGERALTLLASHPATAKHISFKLARYFVDDNPPDSLVEKLTTVFLTTQGNLTEVYSALFSSEEFWDKKYYRSKIKKPFHYMVSAIRALGGEIELDAKLLHFVIDMGEEIYHCGPPTGYKDTAETWVNPGAMVGRMNYALKLAANRIEGVEIQRPIFKDPKNVNEVIESLALSLLHGSISENSEKVIEQELKSDNAMMADGEIRPLSQSKATALLLSSPEFQRR